MIVVAMTKTNPYSGVVSDYVHSEADFRDLQVRLIYCHILDLCGSLTTAPHGDAADGVAPAARDDGAPLSPVGMLGAFGALAC